ncbi:MAG: DUF6335 family protein [Leptolyngbyaceae cyanobacterium bins.349]|nr:DUF6335 family protein [Leptolyngbyaceae cyanobacterium bins.349]
MVEPTHLNQTAKFDGVKEQAEADIRAELGEAALLGDAELEEIESLQQEVGMVEVPYDPAMLEAIAADDTDDNFDIDDDGVTDEADGEIISDLPQEMTQSYGTGLQGQPTDRAGRYSRRSDKHMAIDADPILTGGDIDANYEQAEAVGDEAVGGTVSTPDQDIVDEVAAAVGLEIDDRTDVRMTAILEERDDRRWELDPKSSEDYQERRD